MRCLSLTTLVAGVCATAVEAAFPAGPFTSSGRWVKDASGANVNFAGVNWPGAGEVMIPEGLQYQSVNGIVSKIKSLGMNVVRLTYAIEMVDQIYDKGMADVPLQTAFTNALGETNGSAVFSQVMAKNPSFNSSITRLQVYDAIAAECAMQKIYVLLDNHVSKAQWCCSPLDGNSWWGDTYFSASNWTRGLSFMAEHSKSWTNLMGLSLRNELRQPFTNATLFRTSYNWESWYGFVKQGASAINKANPSALVLLSGLDSDTLLGPVVTGADLSPSTTKFSRGDFSGYDDKLVLELHIYANIINHAQADNCTLLKTTMLSNGWQAMLPNSTTGPAAAVANRFPVIMSEFGWPQDIGVDDTYPACVRGFIRENQAGWMMWAIAGSYYVREGVQDRDEPWGLLTKDWSDWRSSAHVNQGYAPLVKDTLSNLTDHSGNAGSGPGSNAGSGSGSGSGGDSGAASLRRFGGIGPMLLHMVVIFLIL